MTTMLATNKKAQRRAGVSHCPAAILWRAKDTHDTPLPWSLPPSSSQCAVCICWAAESGMEPCEVSLSGRDRRHTQNLGERLDYSPHTIDEVHDSIQHSQTPRHAGHCAKPSTQGASFSPQVN